MNKKKILIILLAVLAIAAAVVLILIQTGKLKLEKAKPTPAKVDLPPAPKYTKIDLPTDKLSEVFPKDLIQEKDPVILENFEVKIGNGLQTQYTLKYITKRSVGENFGAYRKYFIKNQWAILNQDQKDDFATIRAAKNYDSIVVVHTINQTNDMQIIDLTFTHFQSEKSTSTTSQKVN